MAEVQLDTASANKNDDNKVTNSGDKGGDVSDISSSDLSGPEEGECESEVSLSGSENENRSTTSPSAKPMRGSGILGDFPSSYSLGKTSFLSKEMRSRLGPSPPRTSRPSISPPTVMLVTSNPTVSSVHSRPAISSSVTSGSTMSSTARNVHMTINQIAAVHSCIPEWTLIPTSLWEQSHSFTWRVSLGPYSTSGTGYTNIMARNDAAENLISILPDDWKHDPISSGPDEPPINYEPVIKSHLGGAIRPTSTLEGVITPPLGSPISSDDYNVHRESDQSEPLNHSGQPIEGSPIISEDDFHQAYASPQSHHNSSVLLLSDNNLPHVYPQKETRREKNKRTKKERRKSNKKRRKPPKILSRSSSHSSISDKRKSFSKSERGNNEERIPDSNLVDIDLWSFDVDSDHDQEVLHKAGSDSGGENGPKAPSEHRKSRDQTPRNKSIYSSSSSDSDSIVEVEVIRSHKQKKSGHQMERNHLPTSYSVGIGFTVNGEASSKGKTSRWNRDKRSLSSSSDDNSRKDDVNKRSHGRKKHRGSRSESREDMTPPIPDQSKPSTPDLTMEKTHKCDLCNKRFASTESLKRHRKNKRHKNPVHEKVKRSFLSLPQDERRPNYLRFRSTLLSEIIKNKPERMARLQSSKEQAKTAEARSSVSQTCREAVKKTLGASKKSRDFHNSNGKSDSNGEQPKEIPIPTTGSKGNGNCKPPVLPLSPYKACHICNKSFISYRSMDNHVKEVHGMPAPPKHTQGNQIPKNTPLPQNKSKGDSDMSLDSIEEPDSDSDQPEIIPVVLGGNQRDLNIDKRVIDKPLITLKTFSRNQSENAICHNDHNEERTSFGLPASEPLVLSSSSHYQECYTCRVCNKSFKSHQTLGNHMKEVHGIPAPPKHTQRTQIPKNEQQKCDLLLPENICPNMPETSSAKFKKLPFYEIHAELLRPTSLVHKDSSRFQETKFHFSLSAEQATFIASNRDISKPKYLFQVQLRFCSRRFPDSLSLQCDDELPPFVSVQLNGNTCPLPNPIPTNIPNEAPRRPPRPVNITQHCKLSPSNLNTINIQWSASSEDGWVTGVWLVKKLGHSQLLQRLHNKGTLPPEYTRRLVKQQLGGGGNTDISTDHLKVTLACPLGKVRMRYPCRPSTCGHLQCFDAALFLQMNERKEKWKCPICSGPAVYDTLVLDGYFMVVINSKELPLDQNNIILKHDGGWESYVPAEEVEVKVEDTGDCIIQDDVKVKVEEFDSGR